MKKLYLLIFFLIFSGSKATDLIVENIYSNSFKKAYTLNPSIPKGILEAISYTQTRFTHLKNNTETSCVGYPNTFGLMGLVLDGKNYFRNNLVKISQLSGYTEDAIISSAENSVLAYASAFSGLQREKNIFSNDISQYVSILIELSELPLTNDLHNNFALNTHLYQIFWFLNNSQFQDCYNFPQYQINLEEIFGDNLQILNSKGIKISEDEIKNDKGDKFNQNNQINVSPDYPSAIYTPAASCNYSNRNGVQISAVTIHFVQGTYAGCISWFQNCSASASAHYVIRSSDGQVTQMVLESLKAWHVGSENPYTVGIEHEGYINNISWFSNAMYNSSGVLTRDICNDNNINKLRTYYGPSCSGSSNQCLQGNCVKVKGHQMNPNQTHTDPGPNWNWERFYKIINNTYSITTTYTNVTGTFYDSGGPGANYTDDERRFWLFTRPVTNNITLSFTQFGLENNYDKLFVYNGGSVNSPIIGVFSGTINPGPVTSVNDSVLVEFRSDCGTTAPGWAADYVMNGTVVPTPSDNIAPTTIVSADNSWKTTAFTSTITDIDNIGGSGVQKGYYQVIDFDGTEWRANYTKGFFADNFDNAIHAEWTVKTGTWNSTGNALVQSDELSLGAANTNIYAALTQSLSNRYLYNFTAKFEGSGVSRRAGFHFFSDEADSSNRNNSYFVWFRLDDQKVQIYKVQNNVFGAPKVDIPLTFSAGQWYDIKTIYDRITGKITVYWNNSIIATWIDNAPYTDGKYISFRSGNCKFSIDEIKVYRSRSNIVNINVGAGNANEMRYQNPNPTSFAGKIKSICQDTAGNLSSIFYSDVNIDWTAPYNLVFINDGVATDIDNVVTKDSLRAWWSTTFDPHSAIANYWYSIGTAPGSTNTLGWTANWGSSTVTVKNLSLAHNTVYYFNVKAENGAGLFSNVISSNGQKVDTNVFAISIPEIKNLHEVKIFPNPFSNYFNFKIKNSLGSDIKIILTDVLGRIILPIEIKEKTLAIDKTIYTENLKSGTYFLEVNVGGIIYHHKLIKE